MCALTGLIPLHLWSSDVTLSYEYFYFYLQLITPVSSLSDSDDTGVMSWAESNIVLWFIQ